MNSEATVTEEEAREAVERRRPRSAVIFETIRQEGADELERAIPALFFSALAAGLSMMFSLIASGTLRAALPDAPWRPLITAFGYAIGFLIVILGRQQLFTENTLTPILPVLNDPKTWRIRALGTLWLTVLAGNLVGALIASAVVAFTPAFGEGPRAAFAAIARETVAPTFAALVAKGVIAGWIIALMVWLLPLADTFATVIILILTWLVSAAGLAHIIAGSVEAFYGAWSGATSWADYVHFAIPTLLGNIIGGVAFVAAVSSAEIAAERSQPGRRKRTF